MPSSQIRRTGSGSSWLTMTTVAPRPSLNSRISSSSRLGGDRIQSRGRLVEEQDFGVKGEGAGQARALAHAAREFRRHPVRRPRQVRRSASLSRTSAAIAPAVEAREHLQRQRHVLGHRHRAPERAALEQNAEAAADRPASRLGGGPVVLAVHQDRPGAGRSKPTIAFSTVLLPQPLPPMIAKIEPRRTEKSRSR